MRRLNRLYHEKTRRLGGRSVGSPKRSEGFDGDIVVRNSKQGPNLYIKQDNSWYRTPVNITDINDNIPGTDKSIDKFCFSDNFPPLSSAATFKCNQINNSTPAATLKVDFALGNKVWAEITANTVFNLRPPKIAEDNCFNLASNCILVISHTNPGSITMNAIGQDNSAITIKWMNATGYPGVTANNPAIDVFTFLYISNNSGDEYWLGSKLANFV